MTQFLLNVSDKQDQVDAVYSELSKQFDGKLRDILKQKLNTY